MNTNSKFPLPYAMIRNHGVWHLFRGLRYGNWESLATNKMLCKAVAILLSGLGFFSLFTLVLIFQSTNFWLWIGLVFTGTCLWLLNLVYLRLINRLFDRLNRC